MNIRNKNLEKILLSKYIPADQLPASYKANALLKSGLGKEIEEVYDQLGGKGNLNQFHIPGFALEFGRFCVILDDQLQFNRYRLTTLRSPLYKKIPSFPLQKYRSYCKKYESECLKSGMRLNTWTYPEAEKHFGRAQDPGDLGLTGSPGWKYNAYVAFLQDMMAVHNKIRLIRLSIWDELMINNRLVKVNDMLFNPSEKDTGKVTQFFERKLIHSYI